MKTVFQRALSVVMCIVLIVCTMSTMAYAAADFTYDRFMDRTSKSVEMNIKHVFDALEENLNEDDVINIDDELKAAGINLPGKDIGTLNFSSINGILGTIDTFSGRLEDLANWLGDLNTLTFAEFEKGMDRENSGEIKIITELLELATSNGDIINKLFSGKFSSVILEALLEGGEGEEGFSFSEIPLIAKELFVAFAYDEQKEPEKYKAAMDKAIDNFDRFICEDLIPVIVEIMVDSAGLDASEHKIQIKTSTTVNDLIAQIFDICLAYVKSTISELNIVLVGTSLNAIAEEVHLDHVTPEELDKIKSLDGSKSVLDQFNTTFGQIFEVIVPGYKNWSKDKDLGTNISNVFRYLADKLSIKTSGRTDEAVMVDVLKIVLAEEEVGAPGDYSKCASMEDIAKELVRAIAVESEALSADITYTADQTFEHVLGDVIITLFADDVLIATPEGKICNVGEGYDVWSVWNYMLNFFLVDKNLDLLINKDGMTKKSSFFNKLDSLLDMFADDGTSAFDSKDYITKLIKSVLDVDFNEFVNLTAGKALNFAKEGNGAAGSVSVSKFTYKALYAVLRNWAGRDLIPAWTINPFHNAFEGENLGKLAENIVIALSGGTYKKNFFGVKTGYITVGPSRAHAIASLLGLLVPGPEKATIEISSVDDTVVLNENGDGPNAKVYATYSGKKVQLEQGVDYKVVLEDKIIGNTTAIIEGIGAYKGSVFSETVTTKFGNITGFAAKGTSASAIKLTWNKLPGAESYNIYNGTTLVKSNVTATSYDVTGLKAGTKYTFKVEGVSGTTKSAQASVDGMTLPAKVTGLSATSPSGTSVKLTWTAVTGAQGYYVQQYKSSKWQTVQTVTTNSAAISASYNTAYKFRVIAYLTDPAGATCSGEASAEASVRTVPDKPASLKKSSVTASTIALTWKAVSGATGYELYDSNGKKLTTTTSTSYTVSGLAANAEYGFKVRAYVTTGGKTYYSAYTAVTTASTYFATPANVKASASVSTVTLSWDKVSEAAGYEICDGNGKKLATVTANSYTASGLATNTAYSFKVRAYIKIGDKTYYSGYSSAISASTSFASPKNVKASASVSTVTLTWDKVSSATGYEIYDGNGKKLGTVTANSFTVKGLATNTAYSFKVRAYATIDGKTYYSGYSSAISASTSFASPKNVKASASVSTVTLTWDKVSSATGYEIYDGNGNKLGTVTTNSFTAKGLATNTAYSFKVRAYATIDSKTYYSGYSSVVSASTSFATPKNVKASASVSTATITWDKVSSATGYEIYDGNGNKLGTVTTNSFTAKGLATNTAYSFKVRAYATIDGKNYYSGYSSAASASTYFATPANLKATKKSVSTITLAWDAVSSATGYEICDSKGKKLATTTDLTYTLKDLATNKSFSYKVRAYATIDGKTYYSGYSSVLKAATKFAAPKNLKASGSVSSIKLTWDKVSSATGYEIYDDDGKKLGTTTKLTYTVSKLTPNKEYSFKVRPYAKIGKKTYYGKFTSVLKASTKFAAPKSLKASDKTDSTVTLTWKKVSGATGYAVEQYKGGKWKQIGTSKTTSYTVKKLSGNTSYKFRVRAYVKIGKKNHYSAYTSSVSATTLLAVPKSLAVKTATATSLTLTWKKVSGAKKYQVYYSTNGKKWSKATTKKTSYTILDLKPNTQYKVKVRVYNSSSVCSEFTSVLTTTTAPAKVVIDKLTAGSKKFTVKWDKVSGAEGYEIEYATSSSFKKSKTVTVKKGSTVKQEIKKLKKGTKYYVRIRAYKTVDGKKLFGKYSEYETVKVK